MKDRSYHGLPQPRSVYIAELKTFLGHGDQRVLLLNGHWGTGKTHFWKSFVRTEGKFIENRFYSYVSLFGASSIADVKASIVLAGEARIDSGGFLARWSRTRNWVLRKKHYFEELSLPYVGGVGALLPKAEELLIEDFLVCFDDLERRNGELDLEQLFGLISVLKEQNRCRVVIICNEEELSTRDRRALRKYREKIIDRQVTYNPLFADNFQVIFSKDSTPAREVFERLRLNNIRVFQQTGWCLRYFEPVLKGCHQVFIDRFHQQCAKLAAVHFAYADKVKVDDLRSRSWMLEGWRERTATTDSASEFIQQLQFMPSDADDFIISYLQNGYCDFGELQPVIARLNHEYKRSEADIEVGRFWDRVWDTYAYDTAQITDAAKTLLIHYDAYLPFRYTADVLKFVKRINPEFDSELPKERAAKALIPTADLGTIRDIIAQCQSEDIQNAAKQKEALLKPRKSIGQLVKSLGETDGWNSADFSSLNEYSEDQLFDWASKADDPNILYVLAEAISRGQLEAAQNYNGDEVGRKFKRVFDRLADRSILDSQRSIRNFERIRDILQRYGKDADPEVCPPAPKPEDLPQ